MMLYTLILSIGAFVMALVGTRLTIDALRNKSWLLDKPNARSNHARPVPRGGGLPLILAISVCLLVADIHFLVILSIFVLASISLLDDWIDIPPIARLITQILSVLIVLPLVPQSLFLTSVPQTIQYIVLVLGWVWFINLYNFMDGIDGITSVETIAITASIAVILTLLGHIEANLFAYALVVAAAVCGFLWWNWHPARIFLGDVGSIPLGFIVFYLLIQFAAQGYVISAMILPAYYILDSGITLVRRIVAKEKIWQAHSKHYYQQAVRAGASHEYVSRMIAGCNLYLLLFAGYAAYYRELEILMLVFAYMTAGALLYFFARLKHKQSQHS